MLMRAILSKSLLLQLTVARALLCRLLCVWLFSIAGVLCRKPTLKDVLRGEKRQAYMLCSEATFLHWRQGLAKKKKREREIKGGRVLASPTPERPSGTAWSPRTFI